MNIITACATYKGDATTERGLRYLKFVIPGTGKKPVDIPLALLPSFAAGDTCAAGIFKEDSNILINARLYPHLDGTMFVVPTQALYAVPKGVMLNQVTLSGGVGFIGEQRREDAFNFGLMCQAPPQKSIGHTWQDSLGFRVESWQDDAKRMKKMLFHGRNLCLGGSLKFENWTDKNGNQRTSYKIRVRSLQYSFYGKNQETQQVEKEIADAVKEIVNENKQKPQEPLADEVPF
tara:strand:+ start:1299 stop:1997 length:699 start_codon:yes stop_codon:yes gene_type:complete